MAQKRGKSLGRKSRAPIDTGESYVRLQNEDGETVGGDRVLRIWPGFLKPQRRQDVTCADDITTDDEKSAADPKTPEATTPKRKLQESTKPTVSEGGKPATPTSSWPFHSIVPADIDFNAEQIILTPPFDRGECFAIEITNRKRHPVLARARLNSEQRVVLLRSMHYRVRKIPANVVVEPNGAVSRYRNRVLDELPTGADRGGPNYIYFQPGEQHRQVVYVKKTKTNDFKYPDEPDVIDFDVVTCPFNYKDVLKDYDWPFEEASKKSNLRRKFRVSIHYAYAKGCVDPSGKYIWMGDVESAKKPSTVPTPANKSAAPNDEKN